MRVGEIGWDGSPLRQDVDVMLATLYDGRRKRLADVTIRHHTIHRQCSLNSWGCKELTELLTLGLKHGAVFIRFRCFECGVVTTKTTLHRIPYADPWTWT